MLVTQQSTLETINPLTQSDCQHISPSDLHLYLVYCALNTDTVKWQIFGDSYAQYGLTNELYVFVEWYDTSN